MAGCATRPVTLQLQSNHLQLTITGNFTMLNLVYNGDFPLLAGCLTCLNCPLTVLNSAGEVVNSRGDPAASQSACSPYSNAVLLQVQPDASLSLFSVSFLNLQHQLKSLIYSTCGEINFHDVHFANITSRKLTGNGLLTIATVQFAAISGLCGHFRYTGGSVQLLNNGFEYSRYEAKFAPFLKAENLVSFEVNSVIFSWNLMARTLLYLLSFGQATIEKCIFEGNIVTEGPIYVASMAANTLENPHFALKSSLFKGNFGRLSSALLLSFQVSPQSILVENCTFEGNYAQTYGVLDLRNYFLSTDFHTSQPVLLHNLTFTGNISPFVLYVNSSANVLITDVAFRGNGDSSTRQTGELAVVGKYVGFSGTYASVIPSNQLVTTCEMVLSFAQVSNGSVSNTDFHSNYCPNGSPGLTIADNSSVKTT